MAPKTREIKMKKIVKLRFKAMGNVLNVTDGTDHWSDGYSIVRTLPLHSVLYRNWFANQVA